MRNIPNTNRSDSGSETPRKNRSVADAFTGKTFYQELIEKANTVALSNLLHHYGVHVNEFSQMATCPFKSHKGGRERTPSFKYFPETNTFFCYGCKKHGSCCDFVMYMENLTKVKAAYRVLELFGSGVGAIDLPDSDDFVESLKMMIDFSKVVRKFHQNHPDIESFNFIENICSVYDTINNKHRMSNEALKSLIQKLLEQIDSYKECKQ